jgi:micrococcal nuclease
VAIALSLPATVRAQVVARVIDGDTIVVQGVGTVRLIGVDTPETVDPRLPVQPFGREAAAFTRGLVQGKAVRLEYDGSKRDKYNRVLAYVYLPDGTFLNAEIIKQGFGHAYTSYPFRHLEAFRRLEREARAAERGLWAGPQRAVAGLAQIEPADTGAVVYVTKTGAKYHREGCRYLARSQIPMSLADAAARYGPCSVCKPPVPAPVR